MITIIFPKPINTLPIDLSGKNILTCEAVLWKCLLHVLAERQLNHVKQIENARLSTYLTAFGLKIHSSKEEKKIYLPLHFEFLPEQPHKEYRFCIRHIPPLPDQDRSSEIKLNNVVWEFLIQQGAEDFLLGELSKKNNPAKETDTSFSRHLVMDLAVASLIIVNSSNDNDKSIDEVLKLENFNVFNYRHHFSKHLYHQLSKTRKRCLPNWTFDYIANFLNFRRWFTQFQSQIRTLGHLKLRFIYTLLRYHPKYGTESYNAEILSNDEAGTDYCVMIKSNRHGQINNLDLCVNKIYSHPNPSESFKCSLTKIVQVEVKGTTIENVLTSGKTVTIRAECEKQSFALRFKDEETTNSFISLLQGVLMLSVQPDLFLDRKFIPPSLYVTQQLRSFGPMSHKEAVDLLWSSNERKPESERKDFLLYQEKNDLYTFTVAVLKQRTEKYNVQWNAKDKPIICDGENHLFPKNNAREVLQYLSIYFEGQQLYPRKILNNKKQKVAPDSIYHLQLPKGDESDGDGFVGAVDSSHPQPFILDKDLVPGFKLEVSDENGDLKRFRINVHGEDRLLVELQSDTAQARDAISQNIMTMIKLSRLSPNTILKLYQEAFLEGSRQSFVFEYPTHGNLATFFSNCKLNLSYRLEICLQVIKALETIVKANGIYHGNIRASNFYVFIDAQTDPVVKLGDPGLVYMYDNQQCAYHYLNKRSPWLAPERREFPDRITIETECYAIGTTLCEVLHCTDDFKGLLKLENDAALMAFFKSGEKIPAPDMSKDDPNSVNPEVREIMEEAWTMVESCWHEDPWERPNASELAFRFRELKMSASDFYPEKLMDAPIPVLQNGSDARNRQLTPDSFDALKEELIEYYIEPELLIPSTESKKSNFLGNGNFGEVRRCRLLRKMGTGGDEEKEYQEVAVKTLLEKTTDSKEMISEIHTLASVTHKNIVKFLHFTLKENKIVLVMEYLNGRSLLAFVSNIKLHKDESVKTNHYFTILMKLSCDVAKGMEFLHQRGIVHCDLAARNILLTIDTSRSLTEYEAKVGDFGLAKIMQLDKLYYKLKKVKGSLPQLPLYWNPPEYLFWDNIKGTSLDLKPKGDVWSFGIMLWEAFTLGCSPTDRSERHDFPDKLKNGWRLSKNKIKFPYDTIYDDFMMDCWEFDPAKRPSFTHLFETLSCKAAEMGEGFKSYAL